ncbi:MAG: hypothetical protein AB7O62_07020 [Pirellulales bacterium]
MIHPLYCAKVLLLSAALVTAAAPGWLRAAGVSVSLSAADLFSQGVEDHVRLSADGAAIELGRGVVIEDDGPAAGYSYRPNEELLQGDVRIRKELIVDDPRAAQSTLLIGQGGQITAAINGQPAPLELLGKQGNYWQAYRFDPRLLRIGKNEFVVGGTGKVWIARDDDYAAGSATRRQHPNRSAKSRDGGKSWNDQRLGTRDDIDGEYYVRLHLDQFHPQGKLTLPVMDAHNLMDLPLGGGLDKRIGPVRVVPDLAVAAGEAVVAQVRFGGTLSPDEDHWSDWRPLPLLQEVSRLSPILGESEWAFEPADGRFFQLRFHLTTDDASHSPQLGGILLSTEVEGNDNWTNHLELSEINNPAIVRSSIPFRYEPFDRPELRRLRESLQLDKVVAGAATEWELIQRLSAWSATRWKRGHLGERYPAWNAFDILAMHEDGTPVGGFCQQYNLVFLQACQSFGLLGRVVSLGSSEAAPGIRSGHETVEIWSNEFDKWVHIDGDAAWYFVDGGSDIPLSLLELRQRQLAEFAGTRHPPVEVRPMAAGRYAWQSLKGWPAFAEPRMIPRNNFLEAASPLPLNQGMRGWFWTGHHAWSDEAAPPSLLYPLTVTRAESWEWTPNRTHFSLEFLEAAGEIRVHLETETPGFAGYWAEIDGADPQPVTTAFVWSLHAGQNRLQVHARNSAGRHGPASKIVLTQP